MKIESIRLTPRPSWVDRIGPPALYALVVAAGASLAMIPVARLLARVAFTIDVSRR